jgi:hypothetical protein
LLNGGPPSGAVFDMFCLSAGQMVIVKRIITAPARSARNKTLLFAFVLSNEAEGLSLHPPPAQKEASSSLNDRKSTPQSAGISLRVFTLRKLCDFLNGRRREL